MNSFDEKTQKALGYYVYMLINPDDGKPFYIGKGQNNRVFDHIQQAIKNPTDTSDKCDRIREIGAHRVKHVILTHGLTTQAEAYRLEALYIDLMRYVGFPLTNEVSGHHINSIGIMTTDEVSRLYNADRLDRIDDNCIVININTKYNRADGTDAIYQATKEAWRIAKRRIDFKSRPIKYVLSEYRGLIIEVFEVKRWYEVKRTTKKSKQQYNAYGFEGEVAEESVRNRYINKSIVDRKVKGRANPISYPNSINM